MSDHNRTPISYEDIVHKDRFGTEYPFELERWSKPVNVLTGWKGTMLALDAMRILQDEMIADPDRYHRFEKQQPELHAALIRMIPILDGWPLR